jgi:Methyltransferase domain
VLVALSLYDFHDKEHVTESSIECKPTRATVDLAQDLLPTLVAQQGDGHYSHGMSIQDRVAALDTTLFDYVESQVSTGDRKSLLAIQNAVASAGTFTYLEIGSYLGGTLQAPLADPRCAAIVSIDPRPQVVPDARFGYYAYEGNSTARMLKHLRDVPGGDLSKLQTIESSVERIDPTAMIGPDICFIDGEHTLPAALRDARFCRRVTRGEGIVVFHDPGVVEMAILRFLSETPRPHRAYWLDRSVFVVELGHRSLLHSASIRAQLVAQSWRVANRMRADAALLAWSVLHHRAQDGAMRIARVAKRRYGT